MKYGFTGTQRGMTDAQRYALVSLLCDPGEFHHGDCVGADAQAHEVAEEIGLKIVIHPPTNSSKRAFKKAECREPKPYLNRNRDIVRDTDCLIATPGEVEEQLRSGTWSTVRFARKMKRLIHVVLPDGKVIGG